LFEAGIGSTTTVPAKRSSTIKKSQACMDKRPSMIESSTGRSREVEDMRSAAVKSLNAQKTAGIGHEIRSLTTTAPDSVFPEPAKRAKKAAESARKYDTSIYQYTKARDFSEGMLGNLLDDLDVSGDLQMSKEDDYYSSSVEQIVCDANAVFYHTLATWLI
jgi:hypothetical protein